MRTSLFLLLACAVAAGFCGCAGYRLGPAGGSVVAGKSVHVQPFTNRTPEPHLAEAVTAALRKALQRDGSCRLAAPEQADIILSGEVTRYDREELSYNPKDVVSVLDFRTTLTVHVTARERGSDRVILDQEISGYSLVRMGNDLTSAERQTLPMLAEDVAKNITARLVDGAW